MTQRLEAEGSKNGRYIWDDGFNHDDVTKIYVRGGSDGIQFIRFDYIMKGQLNNGSFHGESYKGFTQTFEINHLKHEHLESVNGYYTESTGIQALQFKTNLRISELMGYDEKGTKFTLAVHGKKIIGFHGSKQSNIYSLGAYFTWITPTRMEAKGGNGGKEWDDGSDHEGVTKIHVRGGRKGIQYIKFDYVKDGQPKDGPIHGSISGGGFEPVFEIKHVDQECLVSVEGYYDVTSGVIQGLQFKTNFNTSQLMGYNKGTKFIISENGMKIIGFHGYVEKSLKSLGAYFTRLTPMKLECQGATSGGLLWDDGAFQGIRKVYAYYENNYIMFISFDYENDGKAEKRDHGFKDGFTGQEGEFVIDYPNECLTSVEGTFSNESEAWITSLTFKTSKGRISQKFGNERFGDLGILLESKGCALAGFHGRSDDSVLMAIGAYFYPMSSDANKLEAKGGDGGAFWDDGRFDGVRKIYIGISSNAICFVKFMYYKDARMFFGDDHGNKTHLFGVKEFELNYPFEYVTSVEGSYDNISGAITMLRLKTNRQTSPDFGVGTTSSFVVHKDNHMIVGFHGKSSNLLLHKIGVHVIPI